MTDLALFGLAVYRLSVLLVRDRGPADIFVKMRLRVGVHFNEMNEETDDGSFLPSIFTCVRCMSVWIAGVGGLLYLYSPKGARYIAAPFAVSGLACFLDSLGD